MLVYDRKTRRAAQRERARKEEKAVAKKYGIAKFWLAHARRYGQNVFDIIRMQRRHP